MSAIVKVLSDDLINKIAAGEVVERPASVVKELVENSLDAGAKNIQVEIRGGGRSLIRVIDDGLGMSEADAKLAIQRHATSKLLTEEDLFAIATLGFRGEALAAISGVSRFELSSRQAEQDVGCRLVCDGGKLQPTQPYGGPVGTEMLVRDLFYNTPARLKFMKGASVEGSHILDIMTRLALANPGTGFKLQRGSEVVLRVSAQGDEKQRAHDVLGGRVAEHLFPFSGGRQGIKISGLLSSPKLSRSGWSSFYAFVNGRALRDRVLMRSVAEAYRAVLPKGRYPVVILHIDMPVQEVDVNVHPGKLEVRFARVRMLSEMVVDALRSTLLKTPWIVKGKQQPLPGVRVVEGAKQPHMKLIEEAKLKAPLGPLFRGASPGNSEGEAYEKRGQGAKRAPPADSMPAIHYPKSKLVEGAAEASVTWRLIKASEDEASETPGKVSEGEKTADVPSKALSNHPKDDVMGQRLDSKPSPEIPSPHPPQPQGGEQPGQALGRTFEKGTIPELQSIGPFATRLLMAEGHGELWMIDLHCAREYLCWKDLSSREVPERQRLLVPRVIEVPAREARAILGQIETLCGLGLDVEPFGGLSFAVKSLPKALLKADPEVLLIDLSQQLCKLSAALSPENARQQILATMACHGTLPSEDELGESEQKELLSRLQGAPEDYVCAHGRRLTSRFNNKALDRFFRRR